MGINKKNIPTFPIPVKNSCSICFSKKIGFNISICTKLKKEGFFDKKEATIRPMKLRRNWLAYAAAIAVLIVASMFFLKSLLSLPCDTR